MTSTKYDRFISDLKLEYRPQREWAEGRGLFLIIGHFLVGVAGGAWAYGRIFGVAECLLLAYALAAAGGLAHLVNLGRPERAWRMMRCVRTSWVARGFWGLSFFLLGGLLYLPPQFISVPWSVGSPVAVLGDGLSWIGTVLMIGYMGFVYSASKAIPFWNSPLHPVLYVTYALRGGAAALLLVGAVLNRQLGMERGLLQFWVAITALVVVLWAIEFQVVLSSGEGAARQSILDLLKGRLALYVYGGILFVGLLVPVFLLSDIAVPLTRETMAVIGIASIAGDFFIKLSSVKAGVHLPLSISPQRR
jgi:formate-dependent nitrite reductase membrane component NrfD